MGEFSFEHILCQNLPGYWLQVGPCVVLQVSLLVPTGSLLPIMLHRVRVKGRLSSSSSCYAPVVHTHRHTGNTGQRQRNKTQHATSHKVFHSWTQSNKHYFLMKWRPVDPCGKPTNWTPVVDLLLCKCKYCRISTQ